MAWDERVYGANMTRPVQHRRGQRFNMGAMENRVSTSLTPLHPRRPPPRPTSIIRVEASSRMNIFTTGRATASPAANVPAELKEASPSFATRAFRPIWVAPGQAIEESCLLRAAQFPEDAARSRTRSVPTVLGNLDFYTATLLTGCRYHPVMATMVGPDRFRKGTDSISTRTRRGGDVRGFRQGDRGRRRHDLGQFARWYEQAGTPRSTVVAERAATGRSISCRPSRRRPAIRRSSDDDAAALAAFAMDGSGDAIPTIVIVTVRPSASRSQICGATGTVVNRGFSAPSRDFDRRG